MNIAENSRVLVLVRHGESEGNAENIFTGWIDRGLTRRGEEEARAIGRRFRDLRLVFDHVFVSMLGRTMATARLLVEELGTEPGDFRAAADLDERDYGQLSGLNKDEARRRWGDEQVRQWRRSYAISPPGGESLRDVVARAAPYYLRSILPLVLRGRKTLVVSHGNVLRALTMAMEGYDPDAIQTIEYAPGEAVIYRLEADATIMTRERLPAPDLDRR